MKQNNEKRFLGVHIDIAIEEYLSLWVLAKGTRRTKVMRKLIEDWYEENRKGDSEEYLLKKITQQVSIQWATQKTQINSSLQRRRDKLDVAFELFKSASRQELSKRGLSRSMINEVIKNLEI